MRYCLPDMSEPHDDQILSFYDFRLLWTTYNCYGDLYLVYVSDFLEQGMRYWVTLIDKKIKQQFINNEIDLYGALTVAGRGFLVDVNDSGSMDRIQFMEVDEVSRDYLPDEGVFFEYNSRQD